MREANRRFYEALESLDMEAMAGCWSHGPEVACVHPGGPLQRGWDAVRAGWTAVMAATARFDLEVDEVQVTVQDPVAWVTCVERIAASGASGTPAVAEVAATNVFVLGATGWRLVLHHASPVVRPGPG